MIYITGANGFVGKAIYLWLQKKSYDVISIKRNTSLEVLPKKEEENYLIHCAWEGVLGRERNNDLQEKNFELTNKILDFIETYKIKRVIAFGSQAEYGSPNKKVSENYPLSPTTLYGETKIKVYDLFNRRLSNTNVEFIWLRLFDPYGPGDRPEWFLPFVIKNALLNQSPELTSCTQTWDFIYIDDVCNCIETIIKSKIRKNNIFNLSSNKPIILKQVVEEIFRIISPKNATPLFGSKQFRPDQVYFLNGCNKKLSRTYNWRPKVAIEEGLKSTINYEKERCLI